MLNLFPFAGSILSFTENLNQLKKHTEPGGYDHLRELIESLAAYDQAYSQREFPIIVGLYLKTIKTLRELAPHLKSQKLAIAANFVADECEKLVKKLVANGLNNGGFKDIQELVKVSSARLKHELQNL